MDETQVVMWKQMESEMVEASQLLPFVVYVQQEPLLMLARQLVSQFEEMD